MKTIFKVRVTIKMEEVETTCYAVIDTIDNGNDDKKEIEILFESVADYVKSRVDFNGQPPKLPSS